MSKFKQPRGRVQQAQEREEFQRLKNEYWFPLRPSVSQWKLWNCKARFKTVVAGRGSGKSLLAKRNLVLAARRTRGLYFYTLPTHMQAKRVAWEDLKGLAYTMGSSWGSEVIEVNETLLTIHFVNGSELRLMGVDNPARAEGVQYHGGVIDEESDTLPEVFDKTFLPALSAFNGWAWLIGIPKIAGVGGPAYKRRSEEWEALAASGDTRYAHHHWKASEVVDEEHLKLSKQVLSPEDFDEQYNASWLTLGGSIFHYWDDNLHIARGRYTYDGTSLVVVGCDFNVDPMCWVVGVLEGVDATGGVVTSGSRLRIFDEVFMRNTTTAAALRELANRLRLAGIPEHSASESEKLGLGPFGSRVAFFGDGAGRARHTNAAVTDYFAIRMNPLFRGCKTIFPPHNPAVVDRLATTNFAMLNGLGESRLLVHEGCVHLIHDIKTRVYESGTRKPLDAHKDAGHMTDALGYLIWHALPMVSEENVGSSSSAGGVSVNREAIGAFIG